MRKMFFSYTLLSGSLIDGQFVRDYVPRDGLRIPRQGQWPTLTTRQEGIWSDQNISVYPLVSHTIFLLWVFARYNMGRISVNTQTGH